VYIMAASIPEYYEGKNIFITGATGFLGKVLVEKLLRSCPRIHRIYCLVRPRRGKGAAERLKSMLEEPLYDNLRSLNPGYMNQVVAISGDIQEENLGIELDDVTLLEENIHIVFHSAATVRFDEPLRYAVEMNVLGVRRMIELCRKFRQLQSFVHISTAYANCDQSFIEEQVYPSVVQPRQLLDAMEWLDDDMLAKIGTKLLGSKPNTYTYTKHLAEIMLTTEGSMLPLAIVRPSIVTAAWMEPFPGWIDTLNGPSGLYIAVGKGLLRSMIADGRVVADMVPVDLPINMLIAVGWYRASLARTLTSPPIFHITTGGLNPFTWGEMEPLVTTYFKKNPLDSCFRRPKMTIITTNSFLHDCWVLVSHLIPAYAADVGFMLIGRKPRMVQLYTKLHKSMETMEYFTTRSWQWTHTQLDLLRSHMTPEDQKTFYFDPRTLHWPTYIENYCMGTKKFILREDLSGLPAARARLKMLRNIRYVFNTALLVILWRLLIANSNLARNSWFFVIGLIFKFVRFFRLTSTIYSTPASPV
jgi:fatty acyl-CoA reductase